MAGFYNFIAETGYIGIVYYSGRLSSQILYRKKRIIYTNLPHIKNNKILDFRPRDYQIEAYNTLNNNNRAILSMPCGTGKTFVSFLLSLEYKNIIIMTPLISTTEMILSHYQNYYNEYTNIDYVLVTCQAVRKIKESTNKNIIASTYDSANVILQIIDKMEKVLIIIDEFHNVSDTMITEDNNMNKILKHSHDILFMSATPKNHIIFGTCKYELSWDTAISNKYICDYLFYYPDNSKIIEKINEMKFDKSIIEKTILINKAYYLLESIKLNNLKKCIVYLKTIKESEEFVKILITLNIYFELSIKVYNINFHTGKNVRNKYLTKFQHDNSCINIMCNVHILDEGIDIPTCDSIYLTHPNNNPISIIQRISRANRLDPDNKDKIAKIFLWTKNKTKLDNIINNVAEVIKIKYSNDTTKINPIIIINNQNNDNIMIKKQFYINIFNEILKTNNISIIFDTNMNIFFGLRDIIVSLDYKNYKKAIKQIKITCNNKIEYKKINALEKYSNIKPYELFLSEDGLHDILSLSTKPLANLLIKKLITTNIN